MSRRRRPEQIEVDATALGPAVEAFERLVEAGSGWLNLLPEVEEADVEAVTPSALGALFRAAGAPVPQVTLMAPTAGRRGRRPAQLGLTHGVGTMVLRRLEGEGLERPKGWKVVQDHVRRGVVVDLEDPPDAEQAIDWAVRAGTLLCPIPTTGRWLAEVHAG